MACDDCFETEECRCGPGEKCGVCFESKLEPEKPTKGDFLRCQCSHFQMNHRPFTEGGCINCKCDCFKLKTVEPERLSLTAACACSHVNNWHVRADHSDTHCAASDCPCGAFRASSEDEKPILRCTCGCLRSSHMGKPYGCPSHGFHAFVRDHTRCGWKPREDRPEPGKCRFTVAGMEHCFDHTDSRCCGCDLLDPDAEQPEEPPLTPEEEEEAAPEVAVDDFGQPIRECYACDRVGCSGCAPPQPERRPPYAVAYSVQGHLFEVALPGDATVRAVDGALVIQHHLGPVAGIVSVLPVINKES